MGAYALQPLQRGQERGLTGSTAELIARHPFVRTSGGVATCAGRTCITLKQTRMRLQNSRLPEGRPGS